MKLSQFVIVISTVLLISCSKNATVKLSDFESLTIPSSSMKGWELYSWPNGNGCDWNYSLMQGTNSFKTLEEVKSNEWVVCGEEALKSLLAMLDKNQYISWSGKSRLESFWPWDTGDLSLPSEAIMAKIVTYCNKKGLEIVIVH